MLHTKCSEAGLKPNPDLVSRCTVPTLFVRIKNGDEKAGKEGIENLYLNFWGVMVGCYDNTISLRFHDLHHRQPHPCDLHRPIYLFK